MPIKAPASSASSLPNTGSPKPTGTLAAVTVTLAPTESPSRRNASINAAMSPTAAGSGQKNGFPSTAFGSTTSNAKSPICARWPRMTVPVVVARYLRAMAPAATRIAVSRADARPPPR